MYQVALVKSGENLISVGEELAILICICKKQNE